VTPDKSSENVKVVEKQLTQGEEKEEANVIKKREKNSIIFARESTKADDYQCEL
jgi:hypothetical protein